MNARPHSPWRMTPVAAEPGIDTKRRAQRGALRLGELS
jgi:hypothetical protein